MAISAVCMAARHALSSQGTDVELRDPLPRHSGLPNTRTSLHMQTPEIYKRPRLVGDFPCHQPRAIRKGAALPDTLPLNGAGSAACGRESTYRPETRRAGCSSIGLNFSTSSSARVPVGWSSSSSRYRR